MRDVGERCETRKCELFGQRAHVQAMVEGLLDVRGPGKILQAAVRAAKVEGPGAEEGIDRSSGQPLRERPVRPGGFAKVRRRRRTHRN